MELQSEMVVFIKLFLHSPADLHSPLKLSLIHLFCFRLPASGKPKLLEVQPLKTFWLFLWMNSTWASLFCRSKTWAFKSTNWERDSEAKASSFSLCNQLALRNPIPCNILVFFILSQLWQKQCFLKHLSELLFRTPLRASFHVFFNEKERVFNDKKLTYNGLFTAPF